MLNCHLQTSWPKIKAKYFKRLDLCASGYTKSTDFPIKLNEQTFHPRSGLSWKTHQDGIKLLIEKNRIFNLGKSLYYEDPYSLKISLCQS